MELKLEGLTVLVTGGTRGIGASIVKAFLREGANVAYCARSVPDSCQTEYSSLCTKGNRSVATALSVDDSAAVEAWVAATIAEFGSLDVIIPNVSAFSPREHEKSFVIDYLANVKLIKFCVPHLSRSQAQGGGSVVTIGTLTSHEMTHDSGSYGSMGAAMVHFVQTQARELAGQRVRLNTVTPGNIYFKGSIWEKFEVDKPEFFKQTLAGAPMGRMGSPEEVASAVVFLSSSVSSFTSGAHLIVDGANHRGVAY